MKDTGDILLSILISGVIMLFAFMCFSVGLAHKEIRMQRQAIANGVGKYELNPTNGMVTFTYLTPTNSITGK